MHGHDWNDAAGGISGQKGKREFGIFLLENDGEELKQKKIGISEIWDTLKRLCFTRKKIFGFVDI